MNTVTGDVNLSDDKVALELATLPIAEARGLPNWAYISEQAYKLDRDTVMGQHWACVGFVSDLPNGQIAKPINHMGLPLLITRDKFGEIHVFHNVCSHRGMKLVSETTEVRGMIRCPYHSWTYQTDGELKSTPHLGGYGHHQVDGFKHCEHGLKAVRAEIFHDLIYINLSNDAAPLAETMKPLTDSWKQYLGDNYDVNNFLPVPDESCSLTIEVECNWKLAVENYLESYHLPFVHPTLNSYSPVQDHRNVTYAEHITGQISTKYTLSERDGLQLPRISDWPIDILNCAEYPVLYPNTFFGIHADQFFVQYLEPISPTRTREHVRIYFVGEGATQSDFDDNRRDIAKAWSGVFQEDVMVVEGMQSGRESTSYDGGKFSPVMDELTHHFHRWVSHHYLQLSTSD